MGFRAGHTKIFFRAGVLGYLEEVRDEVVTRLTRKMQGALFGHMSRKEYERRVQQRQLLKVIQRAFRRYLNLRHWGWFSIIQKTKPLIGMVNIEEEIQILEEAANQAEKEAEEEAERIRLEAENSRLMDEKLALMKRIEMEQGDLITLQERQAKASAQKADIELEVTEINDKIKEEQEKKEGYLEEKKSLEDELGSLKGDYVDLEIQVQKVEQERTNKDHQIRSLSDEIAARDELINKLNKEKKMMQEVNSKASEELQAAD